MPILPSYQATQNVKTPAGPRTAPVTSDEVGQAAKPGEKALGTATDVLQKMSDANDVMQYTEAKAAYDVGSAEIQARAAADPDFRDSSGYHKELSSLKDDSIVGINNQSVAGKAILEFEYSGKIAGIKIDSDFKTKQIAANKVNLETSIDEKIKARLTASGNERDAIDMEIDELVALNIASGVITHAEAAKMIKAAQKTGVQYEIYADTATKEEDSQLLADLQNPKGPYKHLDPDTRLDLIQDSQRRIFQNNQTQKKLTEEVRTERYDGVLDKLLEGTMTIADIDRELEIPEEQGGLNKRTLLSIKKGLQTNIKSDLEVILKEKVKPGSGKLSKTATKAGKYMELINNFIDDETDAWVAKEKMAEAYADGILNPKEMKFLDSLKKDMKDIAWNRKTGLFKKAIDGVKSKLGMSNATDKELAMSIKDLLGRLENGDDPKEAENAVVSAQVDRDIQETINVNQYAGTGRLTAEQAMDYIGVDVNGKPVAGGKISVVSSSGELGQESNQTGLEGANRAALDVVKNLSGKYNMKVTITGLTEKGHTKGKRSHETGDKVDLRLEKKLNKIVESWGATETRSNPNTGKKEKGYVDPDSGAIFWREGNHWDIETIATAQFTQANITYTMEQMNMTRDQVLRELNITEDDIAD